MKNELKEGDIVLIKEDQYDKIVYLGELYLSRLSLISILHRFIYTSNEKQHFFIGMKENKYNIFSKKDIENIEVVGSIDNFNIKNCKYIPEISEFVFIDLNISLEVSLENRNSEKYIGNMKFHKNKLTKEIILELLSNIKIDKSLKENYHNFYQYSQVMSCLNNIEIINFEFINIQCYDN